MYRWFGTSAPCVNPQCELSFLPPLSFESFQITGHSFCHLFCLRGCDVDGHLNDSAAVAAIEIPQVKAGQTGHDPRESPLRLTVGTKEQRGRSIGTSDGPAVVDLSSGPQLNGGKNSWPLISDQDQCCSIQFFLYVQK
jgi:hypothetical protein